MSTLHSYAETAIRRDLTRARVLLADRARIGPERRRAVVDHLIWLGTLAQPGTAISPAVAQLRDCAIAFGREGMGQERLELVAAIEVLLRATRAAGTWTSPDALRVAGENLPWLLDAVTGRGGPGLVLPQPECRESAVRRVSEYRRKRTLLWGPIALTPPRLLEEPVRC